MQCMKCGQETESGQVFCRDCLAEMEKYPVKPGTPVYIPSRSPYLRKVQRIPNPADPEEQVRRLRKKSRWLARALAVSLLALAACGLMIFRFYRQQHKLPTGQDYNVSGSITGTAGTKGQQIP